VGTLRTTAMAMAGIPLLVEKPLVFVPAEAELRIGFMPGDGSWSYLGRDCLLVPQGERTMNFGWDLRTSYGRSTARHEIGHALGMPHEHQNPHAGIIWDTEAVYRQVLSTRRPVEAVR